MERETYIDRDGTITTAQKGDEFSTTRLSNGNPFTSKWRVDDIKGLDFETTMIVNLETHVVGVELMEGQAVDSWGQIEPFKPGDKVDFCADSVVSLLRREREKIKTPPKRNNP